MASILDLQYDDYMTWYESARRSYLEPARVTAVRLVEQLLDERVDGVDRARFRVSSSRVKTAQRSFAKLNNEKYRTRVDSYEAVPDVIDDMVGIRIVCNNLSDINTLQEVFGELPAEDGAASGLTVEPDSHRDYFSNPKPSGYRAYHVNLVVPILQVSSHRRIRVEIQARTLLQDGWGELTHEDTYKPGSTVPHWIVAMSLRMAELLAAVDNIAQDLRTGLDVEAQRSVTSSSDVAGPGTAHISDGPADLVIPIPEDVAANPELGALGEPSVRGGDSLVDSVLLQETRRLVGSLTRPTALAVLAQELNQIFGTEVTRAWANFGGFKRFLAEAVPNAQISGPQPGYIHPPNMPIPDGWTIEDTGTGQIPDLVRELRAYDKGIPLISSDRLDQVIQSVVNVLRDADIQDFGGNATPSFIETLARQARAEGSQRDRLVVRPHAIYVLQVLNRANRLSTGISAEEVRHILLNRIMALAGANSLASDPSAAVQDLREWLQIDAAP